MNNKMFRLDFSTGKMTECKSKVLEIGQRVYGMLGYGGSESGTFIVYTEPDEYMRQSMVEVGGRHRFEYWDAEHEDRPISKKFGIGFYWDDEEPDYRMKSDDIKKLIHQAEIQQAWNERLKVNDERKHLENRAMLQKKYEGILEVINGYDIKTVKKNLLELLKYHFKGVKFTARKTDFSYRVKWTDGPSVKDVENVASVFIDHHFDCYTDYDEYVPTDFTRLFGGFNSRIETERSYSGGIIEETVSMIQDEYPAFKTVDREYDRIKIDHESKFIDSYQISCWSDFTMKEILETYLNKISFYQDPAENKDLEPAKIEGLQLIDYSEKAIAIIGDTRSIASKLKKLGGRFNSHLSCGAGWVFSKRHQEQVKMALSI